jgi:integrase
MEPTTREAHTYQINKHILPWFGAMRMNEIMPSHVREWVTELQAKGVTPVTVKRVRFVLSAIFTTALGDVVFLHPCKGVKTPTVARKPLKIITPEQFDSIYEALPDPVSRLLIETDIESGCRWGELTELRARDLDPATCMLTVSRAAVQVNPSAASASSSSSALWPPGTTSENASTRAPWTLPRSGSGYAIPFHEPWEMRGPAGARQL